MGTFFWAFVRPREGEILPIAVTRFNEWVHGSAELPPHADGLVYSILVSGRTENRKAVQVEYIELSRSSVDERGRRTEELRMHDDRLAINSIWIQHEPVPEGVLDGREQFARARNKARWSWKPTPVDIAAIKAAVNRKAGRDLL